MPIERGCESLITPLAGIKWAIGISFASASAITGSVKPNRSTSASKRIAGRLARERRSEIWEIARASWLGSLHGELRSSGFMIDPILTPATSDGSCRYTGRFSNQHVRQKTVDFASRGCRLDSGLCRRELTITGQHIVK